MSKAGKLFAIALLLASASQAQHPDQSVPFETLEKFAFSDHREARNYIIATAEDWQKLWDRVHSPDRPRQPLPEIDFSEKIVIAVFQGEKFSGGYDIAITQVKARGKKLVVSVRENLPDLRCPTTPVVVQPYHIVLIDRVKRKLKKNASFEVEQSVWSCQGEQEQ